MRIRKRLKKLFLRILKQIYLEYKILLWEANRRLRQSVTVSTKQGVFTVFLGTKESIGRSLYCHREYELDLISQSMEFLRSIQKCPPKGKGTIVDIGANNGVISIGMLYTGEVERAISIEPDPHNFELLQQNAEQNKFTDRMVCLPYAISNQKGSLLLELSDTNFGDHRVRMPSANGDELDHESERQVITVNAVQLDQVLTELPEIFTQNIAVIWIDVQGYEGYVFMGAKNILSKGIPVVSEICPYTMARAGLNQDAFCDLVSSLWSTYWVMRRGKFVKYPIHFLHTFFDELGYDGAYDNIIFTK